MDKSLKKLNRRELLELLLKVTESNEALLAENTALRSGQQSRFPQSAKVGSIAEAALQANGYFEAAQNAADDYLREIKQLRDKMAARANESARSAALSTQQQLDEQSRAAQLSLERIQEQAKTYIQDVQTYANNIIAQANARADALVAEGQSQKDALIAEADDQANNRFQQADGRAQLALEQADKRARATIDQANSQAKSIVEEAQAQARVTLDEARTQANSIIEQANAQAASQRHADSAAADDLGATGKLMRRGRHARLVEAAGM